MLDIPPQDTSTLQGNKMSKTDYGLKAIMYFAYDTAHTMCNVSGK